MRICGELIIHLDYDSLEKWTQENDFIVPFTNMPLVPVGSIIFINDRESGLFFESLFIESYTICQQRGLAIYCNSSFDISTSIGRNIEICTLDSETSTFRFPGSIDFTKC